MSIKNEEESNPNTLDWLIAVTAGGWAVVMAVAWVTGRVAGWW